ncbi:hypothetical protein ACGFX4_07510 [Kitasatospora sp. NPDC048365]|uniref:hypothetical protein n=1 Tax=Kitasatospora sp. NPDC048365 TaxID=3364050 RepID=UPI00372317C9
MSARIAAAALAVTATLAVPAPSFAATGAEAGAATSTSTAVCSTGSAVGRPCVWHERDDDGITGLARLTPTDARPVLAKVELRTQRAWGSPWLTVASVTSIRTGGGAAVLATPKVATGDLGIVCVTTSPVFAPAEKVTTCTNPG